MSHTETRERAKDILKENGDGYGDSWLWTEHVVRQLAEDALSLVGEVDLYREAAQRFVDAYAGNKGQTLGNGAARRALDEFGALVGGDPE